MVARDPHDVHFLICPATIQIIVEGCRHIPLLKYKVVMYLPYICWRPFISVYIVRDCRILILGETVSSLIY